MIDEYKLDNILEEIIIRWGIPGLGIGIVEENAIVYAKGFGVQNLDTGVPVPPESIFCVASITKCFVATAVMQLVERGKINLDAPLVHYLPYFKLDDSRYSQITIWQMLSHTSGMPDMDEYEYDELVSHPEYDNGAAERYVHGLSNRKLVATPGERFLYSNIAYNVLGEAIARVSGQSFESFMKEHILLPAGMPDSTLFYPEVNLDRLAMPHLRSPEMIVNPIYPYHRADAPASFLHSTVVDMCHWAITCLNGGIYNGQRILSPASYELMWTPVAQRGYPPLYEDTGLGWTLGHVDGVKTVSHGGMGFGWTGFFILLPEVKRAAIILCNEESFAHDRTVQAVIDTMLAREPQVGTVSWMLPITQALKEGGIQAAYARTVELKNSNIQEYNFDKDDLVNLTYQLVSVKKLDLAIEVLELNIHAFPKHMDSYVYLAKLYLQQGKDALAEETLLTALFINPDCVAAAELLGKILPTQITFPQSFPVIETERLILRAITPEDTASIYQNFSDPDIARWFFEQPHTDIGETQKYVDQFIMDFQQGKGLTWAITTKENERCIGTCGYGVIVIGHWGEIGFDLAKAYWGKGFMSECLSAVLDYGFTELKLKRVDAHTYSQNVRARHLLEKLDFNLNDIRDETAFYFLTRVEWSRLQC